jgi:hypothetical protein
MNRFDENFNNVDPETSRPFSGGHPDGAWIISIIYGFILLFSFFAIIVGLYKSIFGDNIELLPIMGGLINYALFLPPILLLLHRSAKALLWCLFLLALTVAALIISYISNPSALYSILGAIIIQGYICFYVYGLKKDNLLPNNDF